MSDDILNWKQTLGKTFRVRVTPKASSNRIKIEPQMDGSLLARVYITTVPEDGKANKAVIEILSEYLDIPKSSLSIIHGLTGKDKTIGIDD